jgi:hypothetical protein
MRSKDSATVHQLSRIDDAIRKLARTSPRLRPRTLRVLRIVCDEAFKEVPLIPAEDWLAEQLGTLNTDGGSR